jgi:hypothetical protein
MKLLTEEHKHPEKNSQNKCLEQPNKNTLKNIKLKEETKQFFSLFVIEVRNTPTRVCRFIKTLLLQFCPNPSIPLQEHPKIRTLLEMLLQ